MEFWFEVFVESRTMFFSQVLCQSRTDVHPAVEDRWMIIHDMLFA
jgi:hypothetical protein